MSYITLSELNSRIQSIIRLNFDKALWIRAEISELHENYTGHCYMELIEKDGNSDALTAKAKANCWASTYRMLKPYFESETGETLRAGLSVLLAVTVEFHGVYGFSLNIRDIDPIFTVGELAARRLQIIRRLEKEGVATMNRQLEFPKLPQRIAVISSATAAGYGDFCNQLQHNPAGLVFYPHLFPAVMQGEQAEASIISALEKIYENIELFDVVAIIRGGGATTDLACFDSYDLALNCAQFPLPVITGIGHQRDVSILDMVAHTSVKTPTAAAELLIERLQNVENEIRQSFAAVCHILKTYLNEESRMLQEMKSAIKQQLKSLILQQKYGFEQQKTRLFSAFRFVAASQKAGLHALERNLELRSPLYLMQRGYSISTRNGKRIVSVKEIQQGDKIRTFVADGSFESEVKNLV
jgi:exodeoxyribonuclease VII large subunit